MFAETKFFHKAGEGSGGGGGGGSDSHNKGSFLTPAALREAYPTAQPGDFAIVESTDTVWVWDSDGSDWKDGDTKGQVTSVNNQTGAVTLTASDVGAATSAQGAKADTAVQPGDLATVATTGAYSDLTGTPTIPAAIQVSTMPIAAVGELDKIYQFVGTTDANYTNGYFYKCVSDGQDPATYSWTQTDVQPQAGGLPSQTGQRGKFLTTDGTDASWSAINALQNTASGTNALTLLGTATTQSYSINIGNSSVATGGGGTSVGSYASCTSSDACAYGNSSNASGNYSIAVGYNARATKTNSICIGAFSSSCTAANSVLLGVGENNEAGTFCWGTYVNNIRTTYKLVDNDGTIPTDRLTNAINKYSTMPTAASTNVGWIVQFTGATDSTYTHGYIYECKAQGTTPETYAWEAVEVQAGGGGGLPSQTGNAGKFLTTDGTDASWSDKPLVNIATGQYSLAILGQATSGREGVEIGRSSYADAYAVAVGFQAVSTNSYGCCVGYKSSCSGIGGDNLALGAFAKSEQRYCIALGNESKASNTGAIQIGKGTNNTAGTVSVALTTDGSSFNNYRLLDADGTIPAARHATLPAADGTYALQVVITNGVPTLSWVAV